MPPRGAEADWFVLAVGAEQSAAEGGDVLLELGAGEAFVADHDLAACEDAFEQLGGNGAFGCVGGGELEPDRKPVRRAEQVEAEAPEPAAVRAAVAVAADPGQRRAAHCLARGRAGHWGRVEQAEPVAEARREPCQQRHRQHQLRRQLPQPLVEAGLAGDVGKQMPEPLLGEPQEAPLVRAVEQHLRDRQADQLAIGDPRRPAKAPSGRQEIIDQHVKAGQQSVEVGGHSRPLGRR